MNKKRLLMLMGGSVKDITTVLSVSADTGLDSGTPTRNYGTRNVYYDSASRLKALIKFDMSSLTSKTCKSATLTLTRSANLAAADNIFSVYAIAVGNDGWIEGTKNNAIAGAGEPCWNAKEADGSEGVTTAWAGSAGLATENTDYESTLLGTLTGNRSDDVGTKYEISLNTTRLQQMFGATGTNYGFLVVANANMIGIASKEFATESYRPILTIVQSP